MWAMMEKLRICCMARGVGAWRRKTAIIACDRSDRAIHDSAGSSVPWGKGAADRRWVPVGRGVVEVWPRCFEADVLKLKDYPYICANLKVAPLGSTAAFTAASSALSPMNSTTTPLKEPGEACLNAFSSTFAVVAEFGPPAATMLPGNTVAATTVSI